MGIVTDDESRELRFVALYERHYAQVLAFARRRIHAINRHLTMRLVQLRMPLTAPSTVQIATNKETMKTTTSTPPQPTAGEWNRTWSYPDGFGRSYWKESPRWGRYHRPGIYSQLRGPLARGC